MRPNFALHWQGDPTIIPVKAAPEDDSHAWLAFSFPTLQTTSVMSIAGTHFHEAVLPGVNLQAASLLLTSMPGGWLVQVTAQVSPIVVTSCWLVQLCAHLAFRRLQQLPTCEQCWWLRKSAVVCTVAAISLS